MASDWNPNKDPMVRDALRAIHAEQRDAERRQRQEEKRREKKAARRAKYKQTKDDSFLVFAWKELMR
jgi:hypothetical protein